ncbi:MAG: SprT-like domain-containing protein [Arcobacteraceae bacterium]|nr:SprT-like domain-containing protein [Arcobacteraceae bacterium]
MLGYIYYNNKQFNDNPLSQEIVERINQKNHHLKKLIYQKYGLSVNIPIKISSKIKDNLFGLAVYDNGNIKIILNKNRFQESEEYMIDYVLPHEYAHALMFVLKDFPNTNGGHTKKWQQICLNLEGKKCDRFVKHNDIVMGKIGFIY